MAVAVPVNTLEYRPELCTGCGMCAIVCPHQVFAMNGRVARLVRAEACMECGACQLNCAVGAITVESGVGCASAMIRAALSGRQEVTCGGGDEPSCCGNDASPGCENDASPCCTGR
jgi:NAD-dependent dihydropyrimidine dehydrogenase PreA subunit